MAKLTGKQVAAKARAAGLSLTDASAIYRLHEDESDVDEIINEYVDTSTAPAPGRMGTDGDLMFDRTGPDPGGVPDAGKLADDILEEI